ncbi:MAG: FitA-like ribbon-helix-helix domain-containing protein [Acidimicrobiia bacterium]
MGCGSLVDNRPARTRTVRRWGRTAPVRSAERRPLVRGLPDDVHAALQRRAERRGQSLQQYLLQEPTRLAAKPSLEELLDKIERRRGGRVGFEQAARDIADERGRR